ncbi:alcohol dehydrogenase catalytic domain-containing protein [Paraburkholderia sp. BCC1884]|uniref:alcohol dehydrogenase catalytic domain-containing protein n=1 Tax=Paraburkholderia sp. BCC1884 TaxID=2562668 RepID=UPI00118201F6|nr:alcohol dehydrogenase catalytic domain-containing protein [Paraburkholderia sp. BCC1884]
MEFAAAILRKVGSPLSIDQVRLDALGDRDVLVRIAAAGICHTDWEAAHGKYGGAPLPSILGHEGAGIVEDVGRNVQTVRPGDRVVCSPIALCGTCYYCRRQQPMLCEPAWATHRSGILPGGQSRITIDGNLVSHFLGVSCFAEYAALPETGVVVVPDEIPFDRACLLGCSVHTGVGAALHVANIEVGDSVCVIGCGPIGLNAIQGARLAGADCIIATDTNADRRELAKTFGATVVVDPATEDLVQVARAFSGDRGVDCCLEAAGHESTLQSALDVTRRGGKITILSKMAADKHISLRFGSLMGDRLIQRSTLGGARSQDDIPFFAKAYLDGRLLLDEFISERIGLVDINSGLERVGRGSTVRTVVVNDKGMGN